MTRTDGKPPLKYRPVPPSYKGSASRAPKIYRIARPPAIQQGDPDEAAHQ